MVHSLSLLGKGLHDNRNVFTPHIYCFEHWTEWKVFSQAFHGAGHKCISRECFNWMRISKHLHTSISIHRQIYQGARGITGDIFIWCGPQTRVRREHETASTSWFWFLEFVFCATQIFAFPVITHFISGPKIHQKRIEEKLARSIKGLPCYIQSPTLLSTLNIWSNQ